MRQMAHLGDVIAETLEHRVDPESDQRTRQLAQWMRSVNLEPLDASRMAVLRHCESGAELRFIYEFARLPGVRAQGDDGLTNGRIVIRCQVTAGIFRLDFLATNGRASIAVEIDGLGFHRQTPEQVQDDYTRQRKLLLAGYPIARFTAAEVFGDPTGCWQQLRWILEAWPHG